MTVSGTVTVQAGVLLGERVMAIQDQSGGIYVHLLSEGDGEQLPRGTIVEVTGELAAPYGNLELRPKRAADVVVIGSGGQPDALDVDSSDILEAYEGRLVSLSGTVSEVDRGSGGSFSLTIRDDKGLARVFLHATLGIDRATFNKDQRLRITGLVGQRSSRSGAPDGYRVWPRGARDLEVLGDPPGATPPPQDAPPSKPPGDKRPRRVPINKAAPGVSATIEGTVTSAAGFIDSEGRRVTVQDRTGAILVRYPADVQPAPVGAVIRAWGDVDSWFGAPQLESLVTPVTKRRARISPVRLRRSPADVDEWSLVSVDVGIEKIERDGDSWRAEARLSSGDTLPIAGLASSGISADLLEEGRSASIVGIVRRAHPSATDQRFAIAPRSDSDIKLGRGKRARTGASDFGDDDGSDGIVAAAIRDAEGGGPTLFTASLAALDGLTDLRVRVGGRLEEMDGRQLTLHDDSGTGLIRLDDDIGSVEPALAVGDIINVAGRVRQRASGPPEVMVRSAADVWRAATLAIEPTPAAAPPISRTDLEPVLFDDAPRDDDAALSWPIGLAALGLLALAGLCFGTAFWLTGHRAQKSPPGPEALPRPAMPPRPGPQPGLVGRPGAPTRPPIRLPAHLVPRTGPPAHLAPRWPSPNQVSVATRPARSSRPQPPRDL